MANSYIQIWLHCVFSTKNRKPFLDSLELRERVFAYLASTARGMGCILPVVGGVEHHTHLIFGLSKILSISEFVKELKRNSSGWVKSISPSLSNFSWQKGYGAFSVSHSAKKKVIQYIQNQEAHHHKQDFRDEYIQLLDLHGVEYDERYLFD